MPYCYSGRSIFICHSRHDAVVLAEQTEKILKEPWRYSEYDVDPPKEEAAPYELFPHVKTRVDEFVGDAPQFDDLTMLGIKWLGTAHR
ncbi:MAG: hypothetical protein IJG48_10555 [Mogibacterium sp.]|nr:hypothetical protein [Mogibacterium sp.]